MLRKFIKKLKNLLSNNQIFYPILFVLLVIISLRYQFVFFYKKRKFKEFNINFTENIDFLNEDKGKTHVNFQKKTQKISRLFIISEIDQEIKIALKIYNIKKNLKSFNKFSNYNLENLNLNEINCIIYKWIIYIFFSFPKTAVLVFCKFNGLQLNYFKHTLNNDDDKILNYLYKTFKLKNISVLEKSTFEIEKFYEKYLNEFNFPEVLIRIENLIEFTGLNQDLNEYVCKINNKNYHRLLDKTQSNKIKYYGSSLYAFGHMLSFIDYQSRQKNKYIKTILSEDWISNSCLANYIKIKYGDKCIINNNIFFYYLTNNKFKPDTINSIFEAENSIYRITYDEFLKTGIVSSSIDEKVLEEVIRKSNYKKFYLK